MPSRLQLTRNAKFYRSDKKLEASLIQEILDAASVNVAPGYPYILNKFRDKHILKEEEFSFTYSIRVFPTLRPIYFMKTDKEDLIHAFILIIEIDNYLVIFKKSCANLYDILEARLNLIGSEELTTTYSDNEVEFQKLSLRNITISDRAVRARSYEAANLKGLLSTHSAGRSIPYYFKLRHGSITKSISGTGRVVEPSQRESIGKIGLWARDQVALIEAPPTNNFLNSFAKRIDLKDVLETTYPNAILIDSLILFERIEKEKLTIIYKTKQNKTLQPTKRIIEKLISALEQVHEIDVDYKIVGRENCSKIRKNTNSLTLQSKILSKFKLIENGKEITLQRFIVKHGFYSITFSNPSYMYFLKSCFKDSSGISEIDSILEILQPLPTISKVKSEKGRFTTTSTIFSNDSMFNAVEDIHSNDDYILCDDLGDEWADHITFKKSDSKICFIHSKHGEKSKSASNLHDVVGQGVKNLGNMYFDAERIKKKFSEKVKKNYKSKDGTQTKISMIRKGKPLNFSTYVGELLKDYKLNRWCILSCSFLSKSDITKEFEKMKIGKPVRGNITQLFWIISSFAHAAKDANVKPVIYCNK